MHNFEGSGFNFYDGDKKSEHKEFDTVGEAIAFAMELGYTTKFIIVTVVDYKKLIEKISD